MTLTSKKAALALTLSLSAVAGCSKAPAPTAPASPNQNSANNGNAAVVVKDVNQVQPAGGNVQLNAPCPPAPPPPGLPPIWNADCRFIAFTACREDFFFDKYGKKRHREVGGLFLWDDAIKDVYILNGALAGLNDNVNTITNSQKSVQGPSTCTSLEELNPIAFADGKVLFSFGHCIYYWDMVAEARVTVAIDGQSENFGGPRARVTADGQLLAYVSNKGTVVLKQTDGTYFTKTIELTKIAAEANAHDNIHRHGGIIYDLDISGDGRWLVVNIDGILYLYDVANPRLFQLLPLSGKALDAIPDRIGHVAISLDGRFIAFTVNYRTVDDQYLPGSTDNRLLVLDRQTGMIDTVPYANLGLNVDDSKFRILNPVFCRNGQDLLFEVTEGGDFRVWEYNLLTESLRGLVILNNALGTPNTDTLISQKRLDP